MILYKINILEELKKAGYNTFRIRKERIFSQSTLTKIRRNEMVSIEIIDKLCELLNYRIEDIIEYREKH